MAKQFSKVCKVCGCAFIGSGPAAMYCPEHLAERKEQMKKEARERVARERAASGAIKMPGVGKGGNPMRADSNPNYKHGFYVAQTQARIVKAERRYCERCNADLLDVNKWMWTVHHKDHNHYNHDWANLELLCKRCHQIEHECHKAFTKGATTIPRGSRAKRPEAPDTLQGDDIVSPAQ